MHEGLGMKKWFLLSIGLYSSQLFADDIFDLCKVWLAQVPQYGNVNDICGCVASRAPHNINDENKMALHFSDTIFQCVKEKGKLDPYAPEDKMSYKRRCISSLLAQGIDQSRSEKFCACGIKIADSSFKYVMEEMKNFNDLQSFEIWKNEYLQQQMAKCSN
jgi:hypothetical protein